MRLGLGGDGEATAQNVGRKRHRQEIARPAQEVHGEDRPPPHRVDVRERVGGADATPVVRIVDDRCEEVHRAEHCRPIAVQLNGGGVIPMVEADDQRLTGHADQTRDHLLQLPRRDLVGTATAVRITGQSHGVDVRRLTACVTAAATSRIRLFAEASGHLVGFLIFKISVTEYPGQAGSIPVRLRRFGGLQPCRCT